MARLDDNYDDRRRFFNSGDYIPQYAGIPLQQIQQTADTLANRHYQNLAQASQLQILQNQLKSQALPGAKAYFDEHITGVQSALEDMAKNGGEHSTARINALATAFQSDQGMLNAGQRRKEYDKQTEIIDQLTARGEQPLYDKARRAALENAAPTDEIYNTPYSSQAEKYLDPIGEREEIWKTLRSDSIEGAIKAAAGTAPQDLIGQSFAGENPNLPMFFEAITRSGISGKKIKDQLENAWSTYKNSPSYKQQTGNLVGKTEAEAKEEFLKQGLLRVYTEIKRDYKPTPNWAGRQTAEEPIRGIRTPMSAKAREGFEIGNLDPLATFDKSIGGEMSAKLRQQATEADLSGAGTGDYLRKKADSLDKDLSRPDSTILAERVDWTRTAMMDAGIPVKGMTDKQIADFSNSEQGKQVLGEFTTKATSTRYHAPIIDNIVSEDDRKATANFIKANVLDRKFIDLDTNQLIGKVKDEKGENVDEAKDITKALMKGDFVVQGTADPKHILTDIGDNDAESFTRGIAATVYLEDGTTKRVLVGQLPTTTTAKDINENVLYRQATDVVGRWSKLQNGDEIMQPSSQAMQEALYEEYFSQGPPETRIPKEQFMQPGVVLYKEKGKILPATDYSLVAEHLEKKGVKLKRKK